jgi:hypothetical protein
LLDPFVIIGITQVIRKIQVADCFTHLFSFLL